MQEKCAADERKDRSFLEHFRILLFIIIFHSSDVGPGNIVDIRAYMSSFVIRKHIVFN